MSTEAYVRLFTNIHRAEKQYGPVTTVCTVCGNDTPQTSAVDVSDDPDAVVLVGSECILGWFVWMELQDTRSFFEMQAAWLATELTEQLYTQEIIASAQYQRWQSK